MLTTAPGPGWFDASETQATSGSSEASFLGCVNVGEIAEKINGRTNPMGEV